MHAVKPECKHDDVHMTSYGVGHHHRPGYTFPDTTFRKIMKEPLPPLLCRQDEIPQEQKHHTTGGDFYDRKYPNGLLGQTRHTKAPGHWKVNYMKDVVEKLNKANFRRPLSPSHQRSEFQDEYIEQTPLTRPVEFGVKDKHHYLAKDHPDAANLIKDDISKIKAPTHFIMDPSITKYLDPYVSTSYLNHRPFSAGEQLDTKGQPTYWECEEYPKAWGHGNKRNPLPKAAVPRDPLPMRDTTVFREATRIGPVPKRSVPVPHSGLQTEYAGRYEPPSHVEAKRNAHCAVDPPHLLPAPGQRSAYSAPFMYDTEYRNIGRRRPVVVGR